MAHTLPSTTTTSLLELAWREFKTAKQVEAMARRAEDRGLRKANGLYQEAARHHAEALRLQTQVFDRAEVAA